MPHVLRRLFFSSFVLNREPGMMIAVYTGFCVILWMCRHEDKSRRYKRVNGEPMNEFKDLPASCVFIHNLPSPFLLLFFRIRIACLCRRQLNPNRESKDSSMDAFVPRALEFMSTTMMIKAFNCCASHPTGFRLLNNKYWRIRHRTK